MINDIKSALISRLMLAVAVMSVFCSAFAAEGVQSDTVTVYTIGDSTMANKWLGSDSQERGWAQMLPLHLKGAVKVDNHAADGRSSKSFIDEGRWDKVLSLIRPGDYLIIQFGHNDEKTESSLHTTPGSTFDANLKRFVREARAKGAKPVLMNSIVRRNYPPAPDAQIAYVYDKEGNVLADTHGDYAAVPRAIAENENVPFVDMTSLSRDLVESLGPEKSKDLFMWIPKGRYEFCPEGKIDNTHLRPDGANLMARLAVEGICEAMPEFAIYVKSDVRWRKGSSVSICIPAEARPVLPTAAGILSSDFQKVLGGQAEVTHTPDGADIVVSVNPNGDVPEQGFNIYVSDAGNLRIDANDSHGAAYGLMEVSRLLGVSPWEWWADCTPARKEMVLIPAYYHDESSPSVPYRGIFINDEDWGLMPWSCTNHDPQERGVIGPKTTARIFELLLRLRANLYWPPMHECSVPFFLTPGNREVADKYGIFIGGSHCEPMSCSTAGEWPRRGVGEYDYISNSDNVRDFWESRLKEVAGQEIVYTLGMRGVHDGAMNGATGIDQQKGVLKQVIADQRRMLADHGLSGAPQVFIPYKEVLDVYDAGLEVPDDVTLMWCDDNYGYIRHFPDSAECVRKGGNGIYYHVSYWGRPHDYLWLGTFSPGLLYQQMNEAYKRGIRKMWILNVGDIKPAEYQIELFMDMAWDIVGVRHKGVERHVRDFLEREFGDSIAAGLLPVLREHFRLAHIRKPEFMGNTRTEEWGNDYYSIVRDLPWSEGYIRERLKAYESLSDEAERLASGISPEKADAYFQLVKYPVQAADQINRKLLYAQLARHGKASWRQSHCAYDSIAALTSRYNAGKWRGMMDAAPRDLPVFHRLPEDAATDELVPETSVIDRWNGTEGDGCGYACDWLGYECGAAMLDSGQSLVFRTDSLCGGDALVRLYFLPTHSVNGLPQKVSLTVDGKHCGEVEYGTVGRSEEWKENTLANQAVRSIQVSLGDKGRHTVEVKALNDAIVIDRVELLPADSNQ